jgi:hypothetical protein
MSKDSIRTDDLVDYLVRDLKPVQPMRPPSLTALAILAAALVIVSIATIVLLPMRSSMVELAFSPVYVINYVGLIFVAIASAWLSAVARVPGRSLRGPLVFVIAAVGALFAGLFLFGLSAPLEPETRSLQVIFRGWACTRWVMILQIPAFFLGWYLVNRAAPVHGKLSALSLAVFGVAIAALLLPLSCESSATQHLWLSHFLAPLAVLSVFAMFFGRRLFRW